MRRVVGISLVLGLCGHLALLAGEVAKPDEAEDVTFRRNLAEGAAFLETGTKASLPRALARFKAALDQRPESAEAYYWIGLTYSDLANYDLAARHAEKATLCDRNMAKAWLLWGQSLLYLQQWDAAKTKLDKAHQLAKNDPLVSFNLGRCYFHGYNNTSDALYLFKETVRRLGEPRQAGRLMRVYTQAKLYIGACCLQKDMTLAAISAFKDVLKLDPRNVEARYRLGVAYRLNDRVAEAEKALTDVIRMDPRHIEAILQLGHLYVVDRPNRRLAKHYLEAFLRLSPPTHPWRDRVKAYLVAAAKKKTKPETTTTEDGPGSTRRLPPKPRSPIRRTRSR